MRKTHTQQIIRMPLERNETKRKETSALQMLRERLWRKKNLKYLSIELTLKITGVALDCLKCKKI